MNLNTSRHRLPKITLLHRKIFPWKQLPSQLAGADLMRLRDNAAVAGIEALGESLAMPATGRLRKGALN
jgi:hypothetical protein